MILFSINKSFWGLEGISSQILGAHEILFLFLVFDYLVKQLLVVSLIGMIGFKTVSKLRIGKFRWKILLRSVKVLYLLNC